MEVGEESGKTHNNAFPEGLSYLYGFLFPISWLFPNSMNPFSLLRNLYNHRNLIRQFAWRDFIGKYKGSFFGVLWSFVTPLMMLAVYAFVFSVVFRAKWTPNSDTSQVDFALILFCGMTVFSIFGETVNRSPGLILSYPNYVKKVVFPLEILPVAALVTSLLNAGISLAILIVAQLIFNFSLSKTILLFPFILAPLMAFTLGLAWFLASIGVFVRDIGQPVGVLVTILFFMSGVFFPLSALPEKYQFLMKFNPLTMVLEESRRTLMWGELPDWTWLVIASVVSCVMMQLGYMWFMRTKRAFADVI